MLTKGTPVAQLSYEDKGGYYFEQTRSEMLPFVPPNCGRLLEVGCGSGAFGQAVKQTRKIEVWGVEPVLSAASIAATKLDHLINRAFDAETGLPEGAFDCIVFNDVLEHMLAPEQALRYARALLSPRGVVVASIPNIRHLPVVWELAVHGRWEYRDCGVLDRTHLRFFTRSSMAKMFEAEGYLVKRICGIYPWEGPPHANPYLQRVHRLLDMVLRGKLADMKFQRFAVVAEPAPGS